MRVLRQLFQPHADLLHAGTGVAHAHGFHRGDALRGEQVLGVDHAQRERRVVARGLPHRLVIVEDREAGLHRVVVDRRTRLGDRHAEHVVVIDHQPAQEQVADLVDRERRGLGLVAALGHVRMQEAQRGLLVAMVGQHGFADAHRDGQDDDVVPFQILQRQIARRVNDYPNAHLSPSRHPSHLCLSPQN